MRFRGTFAVLIVVMLTLTGLGFSITKVAATVPDLSNGLVLRYDMETLTGDGKMKDLSENGNHGTLTGTIPANGIFGGATNYTSVTDKLTTIGTFNPSEITLSAWINVRQYNGSGYINIVTNGGDTARRLEIVMGEIPLVTFGQIGFSDGTFANTAPVAIQIQEWVFIAVRWDGSTLRFTRDDNEFSTTSTKVIQPIADAYMQHTNVNNDGNIILIDEANFYNRSLSDLEIAMLRDFTGTALQTLSATEISLTGAVLNLDLDTMVGNDTGVYNLSFQWGSVTILPNATFVALVTETGEYSMFLDGLLPGTIYYFRARAVGNETLLGDTLTFTTIKSVDRVLIYILIVLFVLILAVGLWRSPVFLILAGLLGIILTLAVDMELMDGRDTLTRYGTFIVLIILSILLFAQGALRLPNEFSKEAKR